MPLSDDIRDKAADLLAYKVDLDEFEDWLVRESWNVHRDPDAAAAAPLAYKIELLLSELSGGYRDEYQFMSSLVRLLQEEWASFEVVTLPEALASVLPAASARTELEGVPA